MDEAIRAQLRTELDEIRASGLFKHEHPLAGAQGALVEVGPDRLLNLCANNYLGLANHPAIRAAAKAHLDRWGFGMASVRFIVGTQQLHTDLETRLSEFLGTEDTALFPSCFDANGGVFEPLLGPEDAVISDELNHASIIDGIRLCKARRLRYRNRDMADLRRQLESTRTARRRLVVTDGVFSMDGSIAPLDEICALAEEYGALVMVDDSHAVGFVGERGRGTPELFGVGERVDILTGTLGKALGGASGGYVSGSAEVVALLRQRARPYLFSNAVAPPVVGASLAVLDLLESADELRRVLHRNAAYFRRAIVEAGFDVVPGEHPIVPVMIGDAPTAAAMAARMRELGVYVTAFSYPVVPLGTARIRVQLSSDHTEEDLDRAVAAFVAARESVTPS